MKWQITNLLKLSKLDTETADYKKEDFSVYSALNQSINPFLITMDIKEITFVNEAKNFTVRGDEDRTAEAFGNIIKNCIEHTQKRGRLEIHTQTTTIFNSVIIKITAAELRKRICPIFFNAFTTEKTFQATAYALVWLSIKRFLKKKALRWKSKARREKALSLKLGFTRRLFDCDNIVILNT